MILWGGFSSSGATRSNLLCHVISSNGTSGFLQSFHALFFCVAKMMYVEQRPHDADDDEEEENTDSLVSTVLEALEKLDEHLQESNGDVSLWYQPQRACELFYAQHYEGQAFFSSGPARDSAGWGPTSVRPSRGHPPAPGARHAAECRGAPGAVRLAHRPGPGRRWEVIHPPAPHPTLTTPQDAARSVGLRMKLIAGLLLWTGMGPLSLSDNII